MKSISALAGAAMLLASAAPARAQSSAYDGGPVPRGYHVESRAPAGKVIGGVVAGALGTTLLVAALASPSEQTSTGCDARCSGTREGLSDVMRGGFVVVGGVGALVGVSLIFSAALYPDHVLVRDAAERPPSNEPPVVHADRFSFSFGAMPLRDGGMVALAGAF